MCFRRDSAAYCGMQRLIRAAHGRALQPRAGCPEWAQAVVLSPGQRRRILRDAAAHSCGAWSGHCSRAPVARLRREGSRRAVQVNRLMRASAYAPCNSALHPHFMPLPPKSAHLPHPALQHGPSHPAQKRAWSCGSAAQARFIPDMHVTPSPGRPSPFPHRASTALKQALPIKRDTAPSRRCAGSRLGGEGPAMGKHSPPPKRRASLRRRAGPLMPRRSATAYAPPAARGPHSRGCRLRPSSAASAPARISSMRATTELGLRDTSSCSSGRKYMCL